MFPYITKQRGKNGHKGPSPKKTALEQAKVDQLRDKLLDECDFKNITNEQLVTLQKSTTKKIETLINDRNYVEARKYQELSSKIDREARKRIENPRLAPTKPVNFSRNSIEAKKLRTFDQETEKGITQMKQRHESLLNNFDQLWDTQIRERYFQDSPQLIQMRKEYDQFARKMSKQDAKDFRDQIDERESLENSENSKSYENDYNESREQMILKQRKEMQLYISERKRARAAMIPTQPLMPDKNLNKAKAKLANRELTKTAVPPEPPKIIQPGVKPRSESISRSSPLRPKSKLGPLPPERPEVSTQTDPVEDDELFDDEDNEGVETEEDIIMCGEETYKLINSMLDETVSDIISEIQSNDKEDENLLDKQQLDQQTKEIVSKLFDESYSSVTSEIKGEKKPVLSLGDAVASAVVAPVDGGNEDIFEKTKLEASEPNNGFNLTNQIQEKIADVQDQVDGEGDNKEKPKLEINLVCQVQNEPKQEGSENKLEEKLSINLTDQVQEKIENAENKVAETENKPDEQPKPTEEQPKQDETPKQEEQSNPAEEQPKMEEEAPKQEEKKIEINLTDQVQEKIAETEQKAEEVEKPKASTSNNANPFLMQFAFGSNSPDSQPQDYMKVREQVQQKVAEATNKRVSQSKPNSPTSSANPLLMQYTFGSSPDNNQQKVAKTTSTNNPFAFKFEDDKKRDITDISAPTQESTNPFDMKLNIEGGEPKNGNEDAVSELPKIIKQENERLGLRPVRSRKGSLISSSMSEEDFLAILHPPPSPEHVAMQNAKLAHMQSFSLKNVPSLEDDIEMIAIQTIDKVIIGSIQFLAIAEEITDAITYQTIDDVCEMCVMKV